MLRSAQPAPKSKNAVDEVVTSTQGMVGTDKNFDMISSTKQDLTSNTGSGIISNESIAGNDSFEKLELSSSSATAVETQQQR